MISKNKKRVGQLKVGLGWEDIKADPNTFNRLLLPEAPNDIARGLGLKSSDSIPNLHSSSFLSSGQLIHTPGLYKSPLDIVIAQAGLKKAESPPLAPKNQSIRPAGAENFAKILDQLLNDQSYTIGPITDGSKIPLILELLSEMPFEFRNQALNKFQEGLSRFGKIPIQKIQPLPGSLHKLICKVVGPARPMGCPEPPPSEAEFILAWREGDWWNWDLPRYTVSSLEPDVSNDVLFDEVGKYLSCLQSCATSETSPEADLAKSILGIITGQKRRTALESLGSGNAKEFLAGVRFARSILYKSAEILYEHRQGLAKKSMWPGIFAHALDRHGWNIKTDDLIKRLSLTINRVPGVSLEHSALHSTWKHMPNKEITVGDFRKKLKDYRKNHKDALGEV